MIAAIVAIGKDKYSNGASVPGVAYRSASAVLNCPSPPATPHSISQPHPALSGNDQASAGIDQPSGRVNRANSIVAIEKLITAEPLVSVLDNVLKRTCA